MDRPPLLVAILGATATGKSALGVALAERFAGEVVSCDSTAVYRGFDIGTDKVLVSERRGIPHHMIDVADPREQYSAARYASEAAAVIQYREKHGRFKTLDDLKKVPGLDFKKIDSRRDFMTVGIS